MNPQYLKYRNRMISQGKEYVSQKEWEKSQSIEPTEVKPKKQKVEKVVDEEESGPCFIGTIRKHR